MAAQVKPRLSKAILDMKFMQRTKKKVDKEMEAAEGRAMYSSELTERMLNQGNSNFIHEPSFMYCESLMEGRLSFRGMNPEIERLLQLEKAEREAEQRHEQPKEVTDVEMAAFYHAHQAPTATKTMQKKFQNKRKINQINRDDESEDEDEDIIGATYGRKRGRKRKRKSKAKAKQNYEG